MKAIVLAAGYATRLYPLTLNKAKPLLTIAGRPMIEHVLMRIAPLEEVDEVHIITNDRFYPDFASWLSSFAPSFCKPILLHNDGTRTNEERMGAIGDLAFVVSSSSINEYCLVVAGDNIFDFDLRGFAQFASEHGTTVGLYRVNNLELVKRYSAVEVDESWRIIHFEEKPKNPKTSLTAICLYIFKPPHLRLLDEYLAEGQPKDEPGYLIQWLHKRVDVYGYPFVGTWFDIGDHESLRLADEVFRSLLEASGIQ
ncbi:MAG: nucleotidyltransferase family protein [Armatimonadota bacterium]|nr:nucleotidyltransferase family protein [Armatimonadota bacterium]MCX7776980.1 nucleotidyltransferase family protein [Armatimonadota bacterium]MDW8024814.1 nucleotidyltransferase family protein [Armatimonadota bacterium]